jgi:hypothetical protein
MAGLCYLEDFAPNSKRFVIRLMFFEGALFVTQGVTALWKRLWFLDCFGSPGRIQS